MRHRLLLVRHAKSSWDDPSLADRDRPLGARGIDALPRMRDHLAASGWQPEVVLCSPARRTVDTLAGIRTALRPDVRIEAVDAVYGADATRLLRLVQALSDDLGDAMVVGHNPGLGELASLLAGSGEPDALDQLRSKFPTGAIATVSFDGPWAELAPASAQLEDLFMPRRPRS